jgi:hypothetical protein
LRVQAGEQLSGGGPAGSDALPTRIILPGDTRIPQTLAVRDARADEQPPWQQPYASRFLDLTDKRDNVAWFHFCTGHHVEFLYWEATTVACEHVIGAADAEDAPAARNWLARVATLIRGSAALLHYCAAFESVRYDPCLRASMAAERDDFSGDMSRDFLAMMAARARMDGVLQTRASEYVAGLGGLSDAAGYWQRHHADVVMTLHSGSSLLRDKLARLRRERDAFDPAHYISTVVHSEQALVDYDDYFGVLRSDEMKIGDYWTQAVEKLATVHRSFAMDAQTRTALMRGDGVLLAIVSETLAEQSTASDATA